MTSTQILDRLGSAAFTIAVLSLLLLFVPGLVRADTGLDNSGKTVQIAQFTELA